MASAEIVSGLSTRELDSVQILSIVWMFVCLCARERERERERDGVRERERRERDELGARAKASEKNARKKRKNHLVALAEPGDGGGRRGQQRCRGPRRVHLGPDGRGEASGVSLVAFWGRGRRRVMMMSF